jgi:hypothetical protein
MNRCEAGRVRRVPECDDPPAHPVKPFELALDGRPEAIWLRHARPEEGAGAPLVDFRYLRKLPQFAPENEPGITETIDQEPEAAGAQAGNTG